MRKRRQRQVSGTIASLFAVAGLALLVSVTMNLQTGTSLTAQIGGGFSLTPNETLRLKPFFARLQESLQDSMSKTRTALEAARPSTDDPAIADSKRTLEFMVDEIDPEKWLPIATFEKLGVTYKPACEVFDAEKQTVIGRGAPSKGLEPAKVEGSVQRVIMGLRTHIQVKAAEGVVDKKQQEAAQAVATARLDVVEQQLILFFGGYIDGVKAQCVKTTDWTKKDPFVSTSKSLHNDLYTKARSAIGDIPNRVVRGDEDASRVIDSFVRKVQAYINGIVSLPQGEDVAKIRPAVAATFAKAIAVPKVKALDDLLKAAAKDVDDALAAFEAAKYSVPNYRTLMNKVLPVLERAPLAPADRDQMLKSIRSVAPSYVAQIQLVKDTYVVPPIVAQKKNTDVTSQNLLQAAAENLVFLLDKYMDEQQIAAERFDNISYERLFREAGVQLNDIQGMFLPGDKTLERINSSLAGLNPGKFLRERLQVPIDEFVSTIGAQGGADNAKARSLVGEACVKNDDCASAVCSAAKHCLPPDTLRAAQGNKQYLTSIGGRCTNDKDCQSEWCRGDAGVFFCARTGINATGEAPNTSGPGPGNKKNSTPIGDACMDDTDCIFRKCVENICVAAVTAYVNRVEAVKEKVLSTIGSYISSGEYKNQAALTSLQQALRRDVSDVQFVQPVPDPKVVATFQQRLNELSRQLQFVLRLLQLAKPPDAFCHLGPVQGAINSFTKAATPLASGQLPSERYDQLGIILERLDYFLMRGSQGRLGFDTPAIPGCLAKLSDFGGPSAVDQPTPIERVTEARNVMTYYVYVLGELLQLLQDPRQKQFAFAPTLSIAQSTSTFAADTWLSYTDSMATFHDLARAKYDEIKIIVDGDRAKGIPPQIPSEFPKDPTVQQNFDALGMTARTINISSGLLQFLTRIIGDGKYNITGDVKIFHQKLAELRVISSQFRTEAGAPVYSKSTGIVRGQILKAADAAVIALKALGPANNNDPKAKTLAETLSLIKIYTDHAEQQLGLFRCYNMNDANTIAGPPYSRHDQGQTGTACASADTPSTPGDVNTPATLGEIAATLEIAYDRFFKAEAALRTLPLNDTQMYGCDRTLKKCVRKTGREWKQQIGTFPSIFYPSQDGESIEKEQTCNIECQHGIGYCFNPADLAGSCATAIKVEDCEGIKGATFFREQRACQFAVDPKLATPDFGFCCVPNAPPADRCAILMTQDACKNKGPNTVFAKVDPSRSDAIYAAQVGCEKNPKACVEAPPPAPPAPKPAAKPVVKPVYRPGNPVYQFRPPTVPGGGNNGRLQGNSYNTNAIYNRGAPYQRSYQSATPNGVWGIPIARGGLPAAQPNFMGGWQNNNRGVPRRGR